MVNLVVRDTAASVDFYRRLGVAPPTRHDGDPGPHVELAMPGGTSLELDSAASAGMWHAGWRVDPGRSGVVLGFALAEREAVDDRYAELTAAGYEGRQPPFDP